MLPVGSEPYAARKENAIGADCISAWPKTYVADSSDPGKPTANAASEITGWYFGSVK
jgi:hypothetical protein